MSEKSDLIDAIEAGDTGKVDALIQSQPELRRSRHTNGVSAVLWALYYGQPEIASKLAADRSDLDVFEAASLGDVNRLAELLKEDRQLANAWASDGFQPLGLASFFQQPSAARLLIESGASVDSPSNNGAKVMPLHSAAAADQVEIVRLLLRRGAPVNARQAGEFTALHSAAQNGSRQMLDLLLVYGADIDALTGEGRSPVDYALEGGHHELVERLQAAAVTRRVILRPHDPTWQIIFRSEAATLLQIFEPLLGAIYHIGSTSVTGLLAKPTIDILVEVVDLTRVDDLNERMIGVDYTVRGENGIPRRRYFQKTKGVNHTFHVHVFQSGNPEIHRHLAFRDFLCRHPEMVQAYSDLKEELAIRYLLDPAAYTDGKENFVLELDRLALEEEKQL